VTRLKMVVLPAPLGPIKAVIWPRLSLMSTLSTAATPPKFFDNPWIWTTGSAAGRSGAGLAGRAATEPAGTVPALLKEGLPRLHRELSLTPSGRIPSGRKSIIRDQSETVDHTLPGDAVGIPYTGYVLKDGP